MHVHLAVTLCSITCGRLPLGFGVSLLPCSYLPPVAGKVLAILRSSCCLAKSNDHFYIAAVALPPAVLHTGVKTIRLDCACSKVLRSILADLLEEKKSAPAFVQRRPDAVHVYGVDVMSSANLLRYFGGVTPK